MATERRLQRDAARLSRTRSLLIGGALTAIAALAITLAVVWPGFDARETPVDSGSIWALQSGEGRRYARINLELDEIDTVKRVENPSGLVQSADRLFVFTDGDARYADVDLGAPIDLGADAEDAYTATPSGTSEVASSGSYIAYLTDAGAVYAASINAQSAEGRSPSIRIDPYADDSRPVDERPTFAASTVTIGNDGTVYAYSPTEGRVIRADAATGRIEGEDAVTDGPTDAAQLSVVDDTWALFEASSGNVWIRGKQQPVSSGATAGLLQRPGGTGSVIYVADAAGLVAVSLDGSGSQRVVDDASGTPAAPMPSRTGVYAAWLPATGEGRLWSSTAGETTLDYAGKDLGDEIAPEFQSNGTRMILNDTRSGWVWSVPDGRLVPSSQQWEPEQPEAPTTNEQVEAERVIDPKPPIAVADAFGVRAGRTVVLPVLLNDHDPNEDVLSIVPTSLEGLDASFGTVALANQQQEVVVTVAPGASGTATFRYRITDGTSPDGLLSEPATVTLTVQPPGTNSAPAWCAVEGCLSEWPSPQVQAGGTVRVDALKGWVDPDGDPFYIASATSAGQVGTVQVDPQGTITYQHPDPNAAEALTVPITVTVSDVFGATAQKVLTISVTPAPALTAESFAITGPTNQPVTVDVRPHVSGVSGAVRLVSARPLVENSGQIAVNGAAGSFTFTGTDAGSYLVQYTVGDSRGEAIGQTRITLVDPAQAQVSSPPLTAFVRPGEDTTIDLLSAVSNPAGLVLLASDVQKQPGQAASLTADLVGQSMLRVTGVTDNGQPGTLGVVRYTISDGTGNAYTQAAGEVTVVLLPAAGADPPVAVDDAGTVRVGAAVDIPVLDNDSSPAGTLIALDPSKVQTDAEGALAFASGRLVRFLAPEAPGTYRIGYTIYRVGFPDVTDSANVYVTVTPRDANQAPVPHTLVGRVLSGASVSIPFDRFGVDPDGDLVSLDRIVSQPARGSAAISAEGDAIVYTSDPGDRGQVTFTYQVRDAQGATGTAEVRIGVLDATADPSPVTYSDYVQVQVGDHTAVVRPADNDIDPSGSKLEVIDVRPNAEVGSSEYDHLDAQLGSTTDGEVTFAAGNDLGTSSFVYTVRNAAGDTAIGLIVLKVVRDPVPDYPAVRDTSLTVETREDFPAGIDVVSGRVAWGAGDINTLKLDLWQPQPGITVDGWKISGAVPEQTLLLPFRLTGTSFDGREVVTYGFLRVPGTRDIQLSLRSSLSTLTVDENGQAELDLAKAVAVPSGATLEIDPGRIQVGKARTAATCEAVSKTVVRYSAGAGAPWSDTCTVPVRLQGGDAYTFLAVHVTVIAADPLPELRPASIAVSPGDTASYALGDMTSWASREDWSSIQYDAAYTGDQFTVVRDGATLTITAKDAARAGRQEPVTVTLPSHRTTVPATLTLTVGPAPSTLPKGGTAAAQCSQAGGNLSCDIPVIGAAGEVNPLPGTPLRLSAVSPSSNCAGVTFSAVDERTARASWAAESAGAASCRGSFSVVDAQGRISGGDRDGTLLLDLRGLPADPSRVSWVGYTESTVSLQVASDIASYPAVTGYRVTGAGSQVMCPANGTCPPIAAPQLGLPYTYEVHAVNDVGESRRTVSVQAWSYAPPAGPTGSSAQPVPTSDGSGGLADVTLTGIDPSTARIELSGPVETRTLDVSGKSQITFPSFPTGGNAVATLTATPITGLTPPVQFGAQSRGGAVTLTAFGLGTPGLTLSSTRSEGSDPGSITVTAKVNANGPQQNGVSLLVGFSEDGGYCSPDQQVSGASGTVTRTYGNLPLWQRKTIYSCAEHRYAYNGQQQGYGRASQSTTNVPISTIPTPSGQPTYRIGSQNSVQDGVVAWNRIDAPNLYTSRPFDVRYTADGGAHWVKANDFASIVRVGTASSIKAASCSDEFGCSSLIEVRVAENSAAPYPVTATFSGACSSAGPASPKVTAPADTWSYTAQWTDPWVGSSYWDVKITWLSGDTVTPGFSDLDDYDGRNTSCPGPNAPTPTPTPSP